MRKELTELERLDNCGTGRGADAVKMVKLPNERFYLQIGKRTLRRVSIAPEMQPGLLRLTSAG